MIAVLEFESMVDSVEEILGGAPVVPVRPTAAPLSLRAKKNPTNQC